MMVLRGVVEAQDDQRIQCPCDSHANHHIAVVLLQLGLGLRLGLGLGLGVKLGLELGLNLRLDSSAGNTDTNSQLALTHSCSNRSIDIMGLPLK